MDELRICIKWMSFMQMKRQMNYVFVSIYRWKDEWTTYLYILNVADLLMQNEEVRDFKYMSCHHKHMSYHHWLVIRKELLLKFIKAMKVRQNCRIWSYTLPNYQTIKDINSFFHESRYSAAEILNMIYIWDSC